MTRNVCTRNKNCLFGYTIGMHVDRKTLASWMQCALSPQTLVRCQCFNYETWIDGVHSVSYGSTMASPLCSVIMFILITWGSTFRACVFFKFYCRCCCILQNAQIYWESMQKSLAVPAILQILVNLNWQAMFWDMEEVCGQGVG